MPDNLETRVATALFDVEWGGQPNPETFREHRAYWLQSARAAIAAVREWDKEQASVGLHQALHGKLTDAELDEVERAMTGKRP